MWAAGAFRGSPASTTMTDRRWRASWSAAASPAAEPPMTATSQCRSAAGEEAWSWSWSWLMHPRVWFSTRSARPLAVSARTGTPIVGDEIEQVVRTRLRSLRTTLGLSLDELAARTNLSPSTISRIETGKRTISLDVLVPLAERAARRPRRAARREQRRRRRDPADARCVGHAHDLDAEPSDRSDGRVKMRLEPTPTPPAPRVHPGHDWFVVTEGRVRLIARRA